MKKPTEQPNPPLTKKPQSKRRPPVPKSGPKPRAARERKTPAGRGAARLREAINQVADDQAVDIAQALVNNAKAGNATIARLFVGLAGADKAPPEPKKKKRKTGTTRYIERLAAEPPWEGPWDDQNAPRDAANLLGRDSDLPQDLK